MILNEDVFEDIISFGEFCDIHDPEGNLTDEELQRLYDLEIKSNESLNEDSLEDSGISKIEVSKLVNSNNKFKVGDHIIKGKDLVDYFDEDEILTIAYIPGEIPTIIKRNSFKESFKQSPKKALKTLEKIKKMYENDDSEVLVASFYSDFMSLINDQINQIKSTMNINESLTENIDDVVVVDVPNVITDVTQEEITPKGPETGQDTGVANLILDLINGENSTITDYNNFIANITDSHPEFISVISDIANEENNHVGMLTQLLKQVSPNAKTIEQGELEAEKDLFGDSIEEETVDFEVDDSFDTGFGGIFL